MFVFFLDIVEDIGNRSEEGVFGIGILVFVFVLELVD